MLLSACARPPPEALRFGLSAMPVTLDPRFATDAASTRINRLLYQRLVDFDAGLRPRPALATWRALSPTRYRFTIATQDAVFSDGTALDAQDVKATYDYIRDATHGSPHRVALANIAEIRVIGRREVEFRLHRPDVLFPARLTVGILPRRLIAAGHPFNRVPVGSGPFELVGWVEEEGRLRLRRRRDGQVVEFVAVADPTVRVLKLLRGEIDMLQNDLPPELVDYLRHRPGVKVVTGRGTNFAYLGFNMQDEVAGDRAVRRAIALALDRESIIRHVLRGAARPASSVLPPDHWAGNPDLAPIPYDPARARRLLVAAGYGTGRPPRLVYKTSTDPLRLRLATIIQQQLAAVGIEVELRSYDWGTFYGDIKAGNFQMYSLMWVGVKLPDIFRYAFHSAAVPPHGANRGRFTSRLADRLIERAETAGSLAEQARVYRRLQAHLLETLPYVPLWYEDHVYVARNGISGYVLSPDGSYDGLLYVRRQGTSSKRASGRNS